MLTAVVLIKARRDKINEVAQKVADINGISEVYSVSGRYDLIAIVRVSVNEQLAAVVTQQMLRVEGIADTETLIAFRHYSRHDLEKMFAIGLDEEEQG